jgi:hypothetical protein
MCHTDSGNSDYTLKVGTSAEGHNTGTTNTCNTCHNGANGFPDYATDFAAAHTNVDHQTTGAGNAVESTATCTGNCHTGNMIDVVHNPDCTDCHINTTTDGRLVDSAGAGDGTAGDHTIDSTSSCADCHEYGYVEYTYLTDYDNLTSGHKVQDHDGLTGTTSGTPIYDCNNCHAAATKVEIAGTTHDADCLSCHAADGDLVGNVTNGDTSGHTIGTTSNCADCHSSRAGDFAAHDHADTTNHTSSSPGTTIAQNGSDICVDKPCSDCHIGSLDNFGDVYATHNTATNGPGGCATCHNSTRSNATTPSSIQTGNGDASVQDVIANATYTEGNQAYCLLCHDNKDTTHGGHENSHFTFGTTGCDDCHSTTNNYVVQEVHGGTCITCHETALGNIDNEAIGNSTNGVDGDARLADGTSAGSNWTNVSCTTCHPKDGNPAAELPLVPFNTRSEAHHVSANSYASEGLCHNCHTDPRSTGVTVPSSFSHVPQQMACGGCHVDVNGNDVTIVSIDYTTNQNGSASGHIRTLAAGHSFTITTGTGTAKIQNYGSCLWCHGYTGFLADRGGVSTAYSGTNGLLPNHNRKQYADIGGEISDGQNFFRIGNVATSPTGSQAFWSPGRGTFNIKNAEYQIKNKYIQGVAGGWQENLGAYDVYWLNNAATITNMYTFVEVESKNAGSGGSTVPVFVPVFDADYVAGTQCTSSCDTVTIDTQTCSKGGTCIDTRVLSVHATSTSSTAQLTAIWGGVEYPMSCPGTGDCTLTVDYSGFPADVRWDGTEMNANSIFVISDEGGSDRFEGLNDR